MLSEQDRMRISAAITEVEGKTSGEIFCVLAKDVSRYREVPLLWAAVAAFIAPPLLVILGLHRLALASIFTSWTDESASRCRPRRTSSGGTMKAATAAHNRGTSR